LDNRLTSTEADRDTLNIIDYGTAVGLAKGQCKNPWVVFPQDYYRIYYHTAVCQQFRTYNNSWDGKYSVLLAVGLFTG